MKPIILISLTRLRLSFFFHKSGLRVDLGVSHFMIKVSIQVNHTSEVQGNIFD